MKEAKRRWVRLDRFSFGWSLNTYIRIAIGITGDGEYSKTARTYIVRREYKLSELRRVKNDLVRLLESYISEGESSKI